MKDKNKPVIGTGWFSITQAKAEGATIHRSVRNDYPVSVSSISPKKPEGFADIKNVGLVYVEKLKNDPSFPKPVKHPTKKAYADYLNDMVYEDVYGKYILNNDGWVKKNDGYY
jgi:hypothetical protein